MSFTDELKQLFTRKGLLIVSTGGLMAIIWLLQFILEFKAIDAANLGILHFSLHLVALPIGSLFYLLWSSSHDQKMSYYVSCILLAITMTGLTVLKDPILISALLIMSGLIIGFIFPVLF